MTGAAECELVPQFSTCFADAVGAEGRYVFAVAATPAKARVDAMLACRAAGGACRIETQGCAFE